MFADSDSDLPGELVYAEVMAELTAACFVEVAATMKVPYATVEAALLC